MSTLHTPSTLKTFIDTQLNDPQKQAVVHDKGPLLVIAGAGSGKTRVITARIAYLLQEKGVLPSEIIALTFTNKAAAEMKERIIQFTGKQKSLPFIGTFHSYCLYLLKRNRHLLGYDTFSIIDEDDKRSMLQALLKKSPLYKKFTPQQFSYQISLFKNQSASIDFDTSAFINNRILLELLQEYEREKKNSKCFDFDDLLLEVLRLFKNEAFKKDHMHRVSHILIDEYQDTNVVQHMFLKEMTLNEGSKDLAIDSLCVVGDEDQSIYSWRGATVDNIMGFSREFSNTTTIKIEQNYRSRAPILQVANHVIKHNMNRNEKKLWSDKSGTDCIRLLYCASSYQEADIIAHYARSLQARSELQETAVLYRTHAQSRTIEEALIKYSIPYTLVGGIRFYDRKEIKDILAYVRLIINPFDRLAFSRAITTPSRGLGDKFIEYFFAIWDDQATLTWLEIAGKILEAPLLSSSKKEVLHQFTEIFKNLTSQSSAVETISHILTSIDYRTYIKTAYEPQEAFERLENIKELINAVHYFASQDKITLEAVLDEISLLQEKADKDSEKDPGITLMTLHAAKGLEFSNVIIPGLEEGLFPSMRTSYDINEIEEERRLFYVGITRACNRLLITHSRHRQMYGRMEEASPSRFLKEINVPYVKEDNAHQWHSSEITRYIHSWLTGKEDTNYQKELSNQTNKTSLSQKHSQKTTQIGVSSQKIATSLKKHQTVKHAVFGLGIICDIEQKENKTFVTAQFKDGLKKIESSFLQTL